MTNVRLFILNVDCILESLQLKWSLRWCEIGFGIVPIPVIVAIAFEPAAIRAFVNSAVSPRRLQDDGILDDGVDLKMLFVLEMDAFTDSRLAGRIDSIRHARLRRDSRRVHDQGIALPVTDRLARVGGIGIARVRASIGVDSPHGGALFQKHCDSPRSKQELDSKGITHNVRHAPRGTALRFRLSLTGR